jgi:hypothetical protein
VRPTSVGYDEARAHAYLREFASRLASRPDITAVSAADGAPFMSSSSTRLRPVGQTSPEGLARSYTTTVLLPGYFETVGIPLLRGRDFTVEDLAAPGREGRHVVILSERLAHRLFGTADALGRVVEFPVMGKQGRGYEVIGVAADARYRDLTSDLAPMVYEPAASTRELSLNVMLLVRARHRVNLTPEVRAIGAALEPALPVEAMPVTDLIARARAEWDGLARLIGGLAIVASVLAAIGLYGVMAFGVAARRREFGIRLALGATAARVHGLVLRRSAAIAAAGLVFGLGGAFALTRALQSRLVGVHPFDPLIWALAAIALLAIAVVASLVPARQATRVDITSTLRAL